MYKRQAIHYQEWFINSVAAYNLVQFNFTKIVIARNVAVQADPVKNVTVNNANDSNYLLSWSHPSLCSLIFRISFVRPGSNDKQVHFSV